MSSPVLHVHPFTIIESHLDTFGHVNNATYLKLFEEARWELFTARGFGLKDVQSSRLGPVILEAHVRFRRELKNREQASIETTLVEYRGKLGRLKQVMKRQDGSLACEAEFVIALWDLDRRKLLNPSPAWSAIFEARSE